jgi:YebC/PmpR family DNA-binding regulatory protein
MSKHSKWAKVKNYKGVVDAKRAAAFTKVARVITVAAREGGGDPGFNFKLRTAIDQALAVNMPKDNIERAIKKGTGEGELEKIEEVVYEGYGPGGAAIVVVALTDNRNRTSSSLKHIFSVHGGNMAGAGAVAWMFQKKGIIRIEERTSLDETVELSLIDAGAEDITAEDGGLVITTSVESLAKVREAAEKSGLKVVYSGIEWVTKDRTAAAEEQTSGKLDELLEALDDDEDVNAVYSNIND